MCGHAASESVSPASLPPFAAPTAACRWQVGGAWSSALALSCCSKQASIKAYVATCFLRYSTPSCQPLCVLAVLPAPAAAGWDPTVVLCHLGRGSLLEPDVRDDLTSTYDFEELRRAAREELRRAQRRGDKMAK